MLEQIQPYKRTFAQNRNPLSEPLAGSSNLLSDHLRPINRWFQVSDL